jgi:hypothetical protein
VILNKTETWSPSIEKIDCEVMLFEKNMPSTGIQGIDAQRYTIILRVLAQI